MQQWLNEPKNQPIVYGIAALIMVASIGFILFNLHVFGGGPPPYVPPVAPVGQAAQPGPPTGPVPPGQPTTSPSPFPPRPSLASGAATEPPRQGVAPGATAPQSKKLASNGAPGQKHVRVLVGSPVAMSQLGAALAAHAATGAPVVIAAAPNARVDPFAPYGGVVKIVAPPKPRVDSFAPPLMITTYTAPVEQATLVAGAANGGYNNGNQPQGGAGQATTASYQLNGVMLGSGAYALVNADNQSLVLSPGDQIPDGGGQLISIESDSITVRTTDGQLVTVPITTGQSPTNPGGQPPGYNGPPQGYNGSPQGSGQQGYGGYGQQGMPQGANGMGGPRSPGSRRSSQ